MKKLIYFIFFSFNFLPGLFSQNWQWAKMIARPSYGHLQILECAGTGFYLVGDFENKMSIGTYTLQNNGVSSFCARFDQIGNCQWVKKITRIRDASVDGAGNIYLFGTYTGSTTIETQTFVTSGYNDGFITAYAMNGTHLATELLKGNYLNAKIIVNTSGELIVIANTRDSLIYKSQTFKDSSSVMLRLDNNLNVLAYKETSTFSYINQIELNKDGDIYLVAVKDYPCMYCGVSKIIRYDPNFNLLIDKLYSGGVGTHYYTDPRMLIYEDNTVYLYKEGSPYGNYVCGKYNSQLQQIWYKSLSWAGDLYSRSSKIIGIGRAAEIVCADTINRSSIILELDTALQCLNSKALPLKNVLTGPGPFFSSAFLDASGDVFATGFTNDTTVFDNYAFYPDSLQTFIAKLSFTAVSVKENDNEPSEFSVFPNPSSGIFSISGYDKNIPKKICVYDVYGNCLLKKDAQNNPEVKVDLEAYPKGIYFLELTSGDQRTVKKLVMQ